MDPNDQFNETPTGPTGDDAGLAEGAGDMTTFEPEPSDGGAPEGTPGSSRSEQAARARETATRLVSQLQEMIDQVGRQAGPVLREVAAKAAELTAVAAEKSGPAAHRAASVTEQVGDRLATRAKDLAADLHRSAESARAAQNASKGGTDETPSDDDTASGAGI